MTRGVVKTVASPVGDLLIAADASGLVLCEFAAGQHVDAKVDALPALNADGAMLDRVNEELKAYFTGDLQTFTVPLPLLGTPFQQAAWRGLTAIPFGQTRSYGEQAKAIGNPNAVRAVGRANGANFRVIVIPCHRVIGAAGTLTGFGGGLPCKQWLIDHERAQGRLL